MKQTYEQKRSKYGNDDNWQKKANGFDDVSFDMSYFCIHFIRKRSEKRIEEPKTRLIAEIL